MFTGERQHYREQRIAVSNGSGLKNHTTIYKLLHFKLKAMTTPSHPVFNQLIVFL